MSALFKTGINPKRYYRWSATFNETCYAPGLKLAGGSDVREACQNTFCFSLDTLRKKVAGGLNPDLGAAIFEGDLGPSLAATPLRDPPIPPQRLAPDGS